MGKYDVGTIHKNNQGSAYEITDIVNMTTRTIKFLDSYGFSRNISLSSMSEGSVFNPYFPSLYGVGYIGQGKYVATINGRNTQEYQLWANMLMRVYSEKYLEEFTTYRNVSVCKEWYSFQAFSEWFTLNKPEGYNTKEFDLDKDLLQLNVEYKIYSPSTTLIIPKKVNYFLSGVNKQNKLESIGVRKSGNKFYARIKDFDSGNRISPKGFKTLEEAERWYSENRKLQARKVQEYMRSLNLYSEEIIQLIA